MNALVKSKSEAGLWLVRVPCPAVRDDEVLIRVLRTGICGTDLHIHDWNDWARQHVPVPMVIGHEFVGEVVALGADVTSVALGELVSGEGHVSAVPAATAGPGGGTCAPTPTAWG